MNEEAIHTFLDEKNCHQRRFARKNEKISTNDYINVPAFWVLVFFKLNGYIMDHSGYMTQDFYKIDIKRRSDPLCLFAL